MSADFGLVVAFDTDDPEFARGCEVGMLHERMQYELGPIHATVNPANAEMILRLAESEGRSVVVNGDDDNWLLVEFGARSSEGVKAP